MSEVNKPDQGNSTNQAPDTNAEGTVQPTLEELQKEFLIIKQNAENDRIEKERIQRELETKKKELSTRDAKITEFQQTLKQKELEKLSDEDRKKAELADLENKIKEREEYAKNLEILDIKKSTLVAFELPIDFADRVIGSTKEEIQADIKSFKDYIDKLVNEKKEKAINEALAGKAPGGGKAPNGSERQKLIDQYNEAEKRNDGAAMFNLKEKIRALPKE